MTPETKLDWVRIVEEHTVPRELPLDKLFRKCRENPFVPIGTAATSAALIYGLYSFAKSDRKMSNYMMRARVSAQGFTIIATVVGFMLTMKRKDPPIDTK